ncbi:hypothetical protein [Micromonospora sp. SH-82]|uniref:hypothetical protein n=1 Tax=Micromonospora sp. SH-82 TaxID=3132938 RepID=UPI003EBAECB1
MTNEDDQWIRYMDNYQRAEETLRRAGGGLQVAGWIVGVDQDVLRKLKDWNDIGHKDFFGPVDLLERIQARMIQDGLLPSGAVRQVRTRGGVTEYGPAVMIDAMRDLEVKTRLEGRDPAENDHGNAMVARVHRNRLLRREVRESLESIPVGRWLHDLDRHRVTDDQLRMIIANGWDQRFVPPGSRWHTRTEWLKRYQVLDPDPQNLQTYVPDPSRPSTYALVGHDPQANRPTLHLIPHHPPAYQETPPAPRLSTPTPSYPGPQAPPAFSADLPAGEVNRPGASVPAPSSSGEPGPSARDLAAYDSPAAGTTPEMTADIARRTLADRSRTSRLPTPLSAALPPDARSGRTTGRQGHRP